MAGENDTIFGKIIRKELPADIVFESENVLAFHDRFPQAPTHILIIPKKPLTNLTSAKPEDAVILGELLLTASKIARDQGLEAGGYRVVINNGEGAGQTVFHLHLHLMARRKFAWPPG
jgi:histidine triad (HIT) family protein